MMGTLLLVDDNEAFLDSTKDMLELEGFEVTTAKTGRSAIEMASLHPYDLILMDIKMPGINGVECFMEIKKHTPDAKVILMTAYSLEDLIQQALQEGALAVMPKPLDIEKLMIMVKSQRTQGRGGLILLADDNRVFCETLSDILTTSGYRVIVAHDSDEVLEQTARQPIDIMLLDMKFPFINGLEVHRRVRAMQPNLVVVLISGYAEEMHDLIQQTLDEKALCFLSKPLDTEKLLDILHRCIENADLNPSTAQEGSPWRPA